VLRVTYRSRSLSIVLWSLALALVAPTSSLFAARPPDKIADAIEKLGSGDPESRDEAVKVLWGAGRAAEPALREAAGGGDPEAAARAAALLEKIEVGLRPDTPAHIVTAVEGFRAADTAAAALGPAQQLLRGGETATSVLVRLWARDRNDAVKQGVRPLLAEAYQRAVPLLLGEGRDADAEDLLLTAATQQGEQAGLDYAAYLLCRGRLDQAIQDRAGASAPGPGKPDRVLGWLLLLRGDAAGAQKLARQPPAQDDALLSAARHAALDWAALAGQHEESSRRQGGSLDELSLAAYYRYLAGEPAKAEAALEAVRAFSRGRPHDAYLSYELFLLVGRTDEGLKLLEEGQPESAVRLLCHQLRFDDAFALAARVPADSKHAAALKVELARQYAALGEREKATAALDAAEVAAAALAKQDAALVKAEAADVELALGLRDRAVERVAAASDPAAVPVAPLFPGKANATTWWVRLREQYPAEPARMTLTRLEQLLSGKTPVDEVERLCVIARDEAVAAVAKESAERYGALAAATLLLSYNRPESAAACLEAAGSAGLPEAWLRLGDMESDKGHRDAAAEFYRRARALRPDDALATFLQGRVLSNAGKKDEGEHLRALAAVLPLAGEWARDRLADAMNDRGLKDDAADQWEMLLRLNGPHSFYGSQAARRLAAVAAERGEFARAADLIDRSVIGVAALNQGFREPAAPVVLRRRADAWRAMDKLAAAGPGTVDNNATKSAAETLRKLVLALPADVDWTIDCVARLDARGRRDLGDAMVAENLKPLCAVCEKYPSSSQYHNSVAWLCARSGRDLDGALAHATKAVELQPSTAAYLDTLAEVYLKRGEPQRALGLMKKCLELEPDSPEVRQRYKEFEAASTKGK
jgi:predicted Zn-dependent protease